MAERAFTCVSAGPNCQRIVWSGLLNGDTGVPFASHQDDIRLVQVTGTFGAGGSVTVQGTLEATPTNYQTVHDPQGNDLTFTSGTNRLEQAQEGPLVFRPSVTAGDGTTDLVVTMTTVKRGQG